MAGKNTRHFDDGNFESDVLQSSSPVLVDFWAEWCGPCQLLGPVVDELADEYAGKLLVGKVDIDKAVRTASKFGVLSIPTLVLFKGGQEVGRVVGLQSKRQLQTVLAEKLGV
ncbi:MAG: thioredoxin [Planctomycetes bacterium]|nr:thioredoxin [Planctomycetota bacterium]